MIGEAFAADLLGAPAYAHGVNQRDAIRADNPEHGRSGQEDLRPVLMGPEEAKEPCPLRDVWEQGAIVARQPPIERPVAPPLSAGSSPRVTTSLGQRWASGCLGMARSCSS